MSEIDRLKEQYEEAEKIEHETGTDLSALKTSISDKVYFLTCGKDV